MTNSLLPAAFERLERTPGESRVEFGSPVPLLIETAGSDVKSIPAIQALAKRWTPLLRAKRAIEAMLDDGRAYVFVPQVEALAALTAELASAGVRATVASAPEPDIKATRDGMGLTQEQFAIRFGLDLDTVRNWEHGRRKPDTAARSYLRAIANDPAAVETALWSGKAV